MKTFLIWPPAILIAPVLAILIAASALAAEKRVKLPADGGRLYVSLYVESEAQLQSLIRGNPEIAKYRHGNHYNVYRKGSTLANTRFKNVTNMPVAYVQKADGTVVWASTERWCPFKRWRNNYRPSPKPSPKPEPYEEEPDIDEEVDYEKSTPPALPGPNPWLIVGVLGLGVAVGAGSKLYEELNAQ